MVKLTFKSHDNTETKEVTGFYWNMLPSGSYVIKKVILPLKQSAA